MPRSPADATRFTATGPYVSSQQPTSPSATTFTSTTHLPVSSSPAPANETPQQKLARLRAAAHAARRAATTPTGLDALVLTGRRWADRLHRITALGLIGLTLVSGAVATAGITDMIVHNRTRKSEWLAEKQAESARALAEARAAEREGRATEEQVLVINRARSAEEARRAREERPGMWKRVFGGGSGEEKKAGRLGVGAVAEEGTRVTEAAVVVPDGWQGQGHDRGVEERDDVSGAVRRGRAVVTSEGLLDQNAALAADAVADSSKRWLGWLTGK